MPSSPNAHTGHQFKQLAAISSSSNDLDSTGPQHPQSDQSWFDQFPSLGKSLDPEGQDAWHRLLDQPWYPFFGWTCDLLDLTPPVWQCSWSLRFEYSPEPVRESEKRVNFFLFFVPNPIWRDVYQIRQDRNAVLFSRQVLALWSTVPANIQKQLRPVSRRGGLVKRYNTRSPTQQPSFSTVSPSSDAEFKYVQDESGSSRSGSSRNDLRRSDGSEKTQSKKRSRQKLVHRHFCPVSDCTHKPGGYRNLQSCCNHVTSRHADLPNTDREWKSKIRHETQCIAAESESDQDASLRSLKIRKYSPKETRDMSDEIEAGSTAAATMEMGRGFKTPSATGSPNGSTPSPLLGQLDAPTASFDDNLNLGGDPPLVPWHHTIPQMPFDGTWHSTPMFNSSNANCNSYFNVIPPTRTSTPLNTPSRDPERLRTPTPSWKRRYR